jgi:hypothetical protein
MNNESKIIRNILDVIGSESLTEAEYSYVQLQISLLNHSLSNRISNVIWYAFKCKNNVKNLYK